MSLARVVTFNEVNADRIKEMKTEIEAGERPEGLPASEIIVLHDPGAKASTVIIFFDSEADYQRGDEILSAMPADETHGKRTGVNKYEVAVRASV